MSSTGSPPCSMPKQPALANVVLIGFGIVYPAVVFFLRGTVEPSLFIVVALIVVGARLALGEFDVDGWRPALAITAGALVGLALVDAALAARAYPVLMSLAAAGVFAVTLRHPPSLVERFAMASGEAVVSRPSALLSQRDADLGSLAGRQRRHRGLSRAVQDDAGLGAVDGPAVLSRVRRAFCRRMAGPPQHRRPTAAMTAGPLADAAARRGDGGQTGRLQRWPCHCARVAFAPMSRPRRHAWPPPAAAAAWSPATTPIGRRWDCSPWRMAARRPSLPPTYCRPR